MNLKYGNIFSPLLSLLYYIHLFCNKHWNSLVYAYKSMEEIYERFRVVYARASCLDLSSILVFVYCLCGNRTSVLILSITSLSSSLDYEPDVNYVLYSVFLIAYSSFTNIWCTYAFVDKVPCAWYQINLYSCLKGNVNVRSQLSKIEFCAKRTQVLPGGNSQNFTFYSEYFRKNWWGIVSD